MPKFSVSRSIVIDKKPEDIFPLLNNFDNWPTWSPWLKLEDGVKVNVSDDKKYYEWEGDIVGAGNMTVLEEDGNKSIDYDLMFLKPWKSKAKIFFTLSPKGDGTEVTWKMDSSLPLLFFWMKKMTMAFISADFERGLKMLKELSETGKVNSNLTYKGESTYEGCKYIGIKTSCTVNEIGTTMEKNFGHLMGLMNDHQDLITGAPFSIYHKWDMVRGKCEYTACIPVSSVPEEHPDNFITGEIPQTKIHSIHHKGSYQHIGNAWSSMYSRQRNKKFKLNKRVDPMEIYLNSPTDTPEEELETEIYFASK